MAAVKDPRELFVVKLGVALTTEHTTLRLLKQAEQKASDPQVKQLFSHHREETEQQIANLEQVFAALGEEKPVGSPAPVAEGLEAQAKEMIQLAGKELLDDVLIGAQAQTEHHEIALYEGLLMKASAMDEQDVVALLHENLEQEQHTLREVMRVAEQLTMRIAAQTA